MARSSTKHRSIVRRPHSTRRLWLERLEDRRLLAVDLYANDNWHFVDDIDFSGDLSIGDTISNDNDTIATGTITAIYGVDGFGTVTSGDFTGTAAGAGTLQDAQNAANPLGGDTLNVLEGLYTESVFLDRPLALVGPNVSINPVTNSGSRVAEAVIDGGLLEAVGGFVSPAGIVSIQGLTLTSASFTVVNLSMDTSVDAVIEDNFIIGANPDDFMSVFALSVSGGASLSVYDNAIEVDLAGQGGFGIGVNVISVEGDVVMQGNAVNATGDFVFGYNIEDIAGSVTFGGLGAGEGNSVVTTTPGAVVSSGGATIRGVAGNLIASGNDVLGGTGLLISLIDGTSTIQGNTLTLVAPTFDPAIGIDVSDSIGLVLIGGAGSGEANTISGSNLMGINILNVAEVEIRNNLITGILDSAFGPGLPSAGIRLTQAGAIGTPALVVGNTLTSAGVDTVGIIVELGSEAAIDGDAQALSGFAIAIDVDGANASITDAAIFANAVGIRVRNSGSVSSLSDVDFFGGGSDNGVDVQLAADAAAVVFGNDLSFRGDLYFIDNQDDQDIDLAALSGITFDESNNFRIEDKMFHGPDSSASGVIYVVSGNLFVTTPGTGASDESIQAAVDAANSGDRINIETGTYTENVNTLSNSVTLAIDPGTTQVTIDGTLTLNSDDTLTIEINGLAPALYDRLIITGTASLGNALLTVSGSYVPAVGNSFTIIDTAGGVIGMFSNSIVLINFVPAVVQYTATDVLLVVEIPNPVWVNDTWIITNDVGPAGLSFGDTVTSNVGAGDTLVTGKIFGYNAWSTISTGVSAVNVGGTVHVLRGTYSGAVNINKNVTISGQSDSNTIVNAGAAVGVNVQAGRTVSISGIKLQNYSVTGIANQGNLTLSASTLLNGLNGVLIAGGDLTMSSTIIDGADLVGVAVAGGGDATITTSEIRGSLIGVLVAGGEAHITNSKLTQNAIGLVLLSGHASINNSYLAGNLILAIDNLTSNQINAEGNWWGSNSQSAIRNEFDGPVDFRPWLSSGTDFDFGARGFDGTP